MQAVSLATLSTYTRSATILNTNTRLGRRLMRQHFNAIPAKQGTPVNRLLKPVSKPEPVQAVATPICTLYATRTLARNAAQNLHGWRSLDQKNKDGLWPIVLKDGVK